MAHAATITTPAPDPAPRPMNQWLAAALAVVLAPVLIPLVLFAMLVTLLVVLPVAVVHAAVIEPLTLHRHVHRRGRILAPDEAVARLRAGQGTLLIEERGGVSTRAWWCERDVAPLAFDLAHLGDDDDLDEHTLSEAAWAAVDQTKALLREVAIKDGTALLVTTRRVRRLRDQVLAAAPTRVVTLHAWLADFERDPRVCPKCEYDLTGLDRGVCPECGARFGHTG